MMNRVVREPLLHFALLGGMLFGVYRLVSPAQPDTSRILISSEQIASVAAQFRGAWQRPPTHEELDRLVEARVRDEVLYREGLALGLDRDDPVVMNRVKQKMEVLSEDALTAEPTDAELQAYLDAHQQQFALPASTSFQQVYFNPSRRGSSLDSSVRRAHTILESGGFVVGDRTMLPAQLERAVPADIDATFGATFEAAVRSLPIGTWSEPVRSSFGYHLVRVTARTDSTIPTLADARDVVAREWLRAHAVEARERLYQSLRARYSVAIEPIPDTASMTARAESLR